jgi:hypothetical protein
VTLTQNQLDAYARDGYILLSGLIPDDIAAAAAGTLWEGMGAQPDNPETWPDSRYTHHHDQAEIVACFTDDYLRAASQLCGESLEHIKTPRGATAINIFPSTEAWQNPHPHIDHAIKEHGHKTFPRPFHVATMTFLSDVEGRGGGTAVWPGSHQQIEALARSDEAHYEYMWVLNKELDKAGLNDPVVLIPQRGDVLFYAYLCAHAGSKNVSTRPRLALNYKW